MKSRITIGVDFENGNRPIIQIVFRQSEDIRDDLVQSFYHALGHQSSWCRIEFRQSGDDKEGIYHRIILTPVTPEEIPEQSRLMAALVATNPDRNSKSPSVFPSQFGIKENNEVEYITYEGGPTSWGKVVAVKFTEAKVYYDVLDDTTANVTKDIPSHFVEPLVKVSQK